MATDLRSPAGDIEHLVVMGVSGAGKTTVGKLIAARLGRTFAEGDDFHPATNVAKMAAGTALTDADRLPWLQAIRDWLSGQTRAGRPSVVTCSALRRAYRDVLREASGRVRFVALHGEAASVAARLDRRSGHFMPAALLASQYQALEPLGADEDGTTVSGADAPEQIVATVVANLAPR